MKVIVDADACPVKRIIKSICNKYKVDLIFIHSISHISEADCDVKRIIVDRVAQAADMAIVNSANKGDIIVTSDTGLAALVLGKGCYAINPWGQIYTNTNIDIILENRHYKQKILASGGRIKGPPKRKSSDDVSFKDSFENLIRKFNQIDG